MLFSVAELGLVYLLPSLSPTPSTFSILFIFSKMKNAKEESPVCLIASGLIPHSSAYLLLVWATMLIQRTNICQVVCLSLKAHSTLTWDST